MMKVLILSCVAFFLITGCFSNDAEVRKTELVTFSGGSFEYVAGLMHDRGWADLKEGSIVTFSEDKREKGDVQDYYQFHLKAPGKFLLALNSGADYESFFALIDSSKIDCSKCKGCKNDASYYQLSSECYICKEGFSYDRKRYILRVSRDENFAFPKTSEPKTKSTPVTIPPNPYQRPLHLPPIPGTERYRQSNPPTYFPKIKEKEAKPSFGENERKKVGETSEAREADGG